MQFNFSGSFFFLPILYRTSSLESGHGLKNAAQVCKRAHLWSTGVLDDAQHRIRKLHQCLRFSDKLQRIVLDAEHPPRFVAGQYIMRVLTEVNLLKTV